MHLRNISFKDKSAFASDHLIRNTDIQRTILMRGLNGKIQTAFITQMKDF